MVPWRIVPHLSKKTTLVLGTVAFGSGVAVNEGKAFCLGYDSNGDRLNEIKGSLSNLMTSGFSAVNYAKEKAEHTGIVRFGRAAAVVSNFFTFHVFVPIKSKKIPNFRL